MYCPLFSYEQARKTDIVDYLAKLGYTPQKIRNADYWYLSPLREEREASFKVNRTLNAWFDHGAGRGGNVIDFGMLYHKCSYKELMKNLEENFFFHPHSQTVQQHHANIQSHQDALEPKIKIIAAKPLIHPAPCSYLEERKIPLEIANKYCQEVYCQLSGKAFFAIGFRNNSGGFELRNSRFKGTASPKDITLIEALPGKEIAVFEGFMDFLSFQALNQNTRPPLTNFLILNSLSFFEKNRPLMEKYSAINLYLDQDSAGKLSTQKALSRDKKYIDQSIKYKNHKDLNEYLVSKSILQKASRSLRVRLCFL